MKIHKHVYAREFQVIKCEIDAKRVGVLMRCKNWKILYKLMCKEYYHRY